MVVSTSNEETYLSARQVQEIISFGSATIIKLGKDQSSGFPKPYMVGRSVYWRESEILAYLSEKAGCSVTSKDRTVTAKDLLHKFNKSHTWLWQNIKKGRVPKPFYIGRSRFWMKSQIDQLTQQAA